MKPTPLTEADLDEIEAEAKTNAAETHRGALLALVARGPSCVAWRTISGQRERQR